MYAVPQTAICINPLAFVYKGNCCVNSILQSLFNKEITTYCVKILLILNIVCVWVEPSRFCTA